MGMGGRGGVVYSEIMVFKHVLNHIQLDFDILISAHLCFHHNRFLLTHFQLDFYILISAHLCLSL